MKTTIKILRSIATSLLFIVLTSMVIIGLIFTSIKMTASNLPNMIDREELLMRIYDEEIKDEKIKEIAFDYLDDYINYIFHKRSYPSLQTIDYKDLSDENRREAQKTVAELAENLSLEYESVISFRKLNDTTSNRAIYLIINVGIFLILTVTFIIKRPFLRGLKFSLWSFFVSGTTSLIASSFIMSKLKTLLNSVDYIFLSAILNDKFTANLKLLSISFILTPLIILTIIYVVQKLLIPRIHQQL